MHSKFVLLGMEIKMKATTKKMVGITALSAMTLVEIIQMQQANAAPVVFTGTVQPDGNFGSSLQVAITVDNVGGIYKITNITTPVKPTNGYNSALANLAIPTLVTEALAAQSANIAGVSGASSISSGWIASLASAIASAAAAGEKIGAAVVTTTPSPTPTPTTTTPPPPPPTPTPTVAPVDPLSALLQKLVLAGTITQAQATAILAALKSAHVTLPKIGDGDDASEGAQGSEGSGEHSTPRPSPTSTNAAQGTNAPTLKLTVAQDLKVITTFLGITAGQLQADFAAGQSLAMIAGTKTPALIAAIVTSQTARINARVKPGGLTQAQATALIAGLTAAVTTEVNATPSKGSHGFGLPFGFDAAFVIPAKHK